jgi:hypothetical protein
MDCFFPMHELKKHGLGNIIGDFDHKLIWAPCLCLKYICPRLSTRALSTRYRFLTTLLSDTVLRSFCYRYLGGNTINEH